jgi:alkane 1-monooxygenase
MDRTGGAGRQAYLALGYMLVFLPGVLLVAGRELGADWMVIAAFFVVLPLLRAAIGDVPDSPPIWSEAWAGFLHRLPRAYPHYLAAIAVWVGWTLSRPTRPAGLDLVFFGLSWWLVNSLATCVSHEMLHRPGRVDRTLGRWIAALAGYPILGQEHLAHHAHPGDTARAEYPRRDESVWSFSLRRARAAWGHAAEWDRGERARSSRAGRPDGLTTCVSITVAVWAVFTAVADATGFFTYLAQIVGVHFSVQVINYLQHWGLGDDRFGDSVIEQYSWEDRCQIQAWVVMGLSIHQAHHLAPSRPYYRVEPRSNSPRPPAGYAWMMLAALVPPLLRHVMTPALDYWRRNPERPISPGRRLHCFGAYPGT